MATQLTEPPQSEPADRKTIEKVAIVISKGSLEGVYPGLIMANGARMEGIEADLFFTFFGLDAIRKDRYANIKVASVGNPGMHLPAGRSSSRSGPERHGRSFAQPATPPSPTRSGVTGGMVESSYSSEVIAMTTHVHSSAVLTLPRPVRHFAWFAGGSAVAFLIPY